jgi:thiosulfate reductase cytochrome b subunit
MWGERSFHCGPVIASKSAMLPGTDSVVKEKASDPRIEKWTYIYRHDLLVRVTHWVGVLSILLLVMSGLQILNAHPALYWGEASDFAHPIASIYTVVHKGSRVGMTNVLGHDFVTTGVLGLSGPVGDRVARAFPQWATLPADQDLAAGRRWHFFFAWILVLDGVIYFAAGIFRCHFWRDLFPSCQELRRVGRSFVDHLRFRFPRGADATHYNVIQKLAYLVIILVVLPALVLAGLTMSPGLDAAFPFLTILFEGRQSARTVHFVAAAVLVGFVVVHIVMVLVSGAWNNMRSMMTGWYAIKPARDSYEQ